MPSLIVWGERDPVIPYRHGLRASESMPGSRLVSFPNAGHFPHRDNPRRFTRALLDFMAETEPSVIPEERMREMLREGA
jgi:pimeloyl-ACP methyl ester carboxylesterase